MPFTTSDICKIILAIILPPIGVFLERGCGADLLINILLTILGYFPARLPLPYPAGIKSSRRRTASCRADTNYSTFDRQLSF
ncbi:hypothetical protein J3E69DRAFT_330537 [Trichoderma sp. SZMC 28015]